MQFHFSDEQDQFRAMVRRFFERSCPTTSTRELMVGSVGFDASVWRRMSDELGIAGVALPERYGGSAFGSVEEGIVMEEAGRALACSPYLSSSVLAARCLHQVGSDADCERLLPPLTSGERTAALALSEPGKPPSLTALDCELSLGREPLVSGQKHAVIDGSSADVLLVVARQAGSKGEAGLTLVEIDPSAKGVSITAQQPLDPTRKLSAVALHDAPVRVVGEAGTAGPLLRRALDQALIALSSEMVGGAARLLADTLEFTKLRMQFGRTIASFQAIKHRMSELLVTVELAKSAAYYAAEACDAGDPDLSYHASLAKASASDAYMLAATEAIQLHGGIGFTWDADLHLWFKRAKASEVLFGDASWHRERMILNLPPHVSARRANTAE